MKGSIDASYALFALFTITRHLRGPKSGFSEDEIVLVCSVNSNDEIERMTYEYIRLTNRLE